jgi:hypothetical protein
MNCFSPYLNSRYCIHHGVVQRENLPIYNRLDLKFSLMFWTKVKFDMYPPYKYGKSSTIFTTGHCLSKHQERLQARQADLTYL